MRKTKLSPFISYTQLDRGDNNYPDIKLMFRNNLK